MAATGNELVKLSQLKMLDDANKTLIDTKLNKPTGGNGTNGQLLVTDGNGGTRWEDQRQIDTGHIADGAITETKLANGAVTTGKIADDAVTADKIADGIIPDAVSDLTNDLQFQTQEQVQQTVNSAVQTAVSAVYKYKGSVANQGALPSEPAPATGDVYNVEDTGMNYAWNGTQWDALGTVTTLASLGVTASATELNYMTGVTSGVQGQIDGLKAVATTGANGMMSKEDKVKLDGIEAGANKYVLPVAGAQIGGVKNSAEVVVDGEGTMTIGSGINVSRFTNDAGYLTTATLPVASDEDFKTYMGIAEA